MEEIYLSPDGLYEYSAAELAEAAKENKITFEEFVSSRGFKLKGSEVEETVEVKDIIEPTDPPKEESTSLSESVNIFNQRKADLVNEIENRKPDGTLVTSSFELPQEPLVITDEEIKEFDVNFGDVITDIQKKRKSKITNTLLGTNVDGDSIAAPINLSADMNSNVSTFNENT